MGFQQRVERVLRHHECADLRELDDKVDITGDLDDMLDFMHGRIPARLEPPLLGKSEIRKSPLL